MPVCVSCRQRYHRVEHLPLENILNPDADQCPYRRVNEVVRHAGQLKLMCSEIQFLTPFKGTRMTVVYAGAAPGLHIPMLMKMFPELRFILIDPSPSFMRTGVMVQVHREPMTVRFAARLRDKLGPNILFISDVRIGPEGWENDRQHQMRIQKDMESQMQWYLALDPIAGMFKFRLPWNLRSRVTTYLDGEIHLPVFGKPLTHESRLVAGYRASYVNYDNTKYERQMAYFNQFKRVAIYNGMCYDCAAFREIVSKYLGGDETDVEQLCAEIEADLEQKATEWRRRR